jgi:hypothetical protein
MREIFSTQISNIRKFSMRGFLYRRGILAKLRYIFDLVLVVITALIFCLAITGAIGGLVALIIMILMDYA